VTIVSLFSGAGGMDLGFRQAGHEIVWANDIWKDAVETYRLNIGDHIVDSPIEKIASSEIPKADIVIGGFPCQGFSIANMARRIDDSRNFLYLEFVRVLRDVQPLYFVAENVGGLLSLDRGEVFRLIKSDFADAGYRVSHALLNAADYGVPQARKRLFMVGTRRDIPSNIAFPPRPTHAPVDISYLFRLQPWVSIGAALKDIPEPSQAHLLANHDHSRYKLRFNGYLGHRRIDPDLPAPTITARGDERGGVVVLHHPSNTRRLTAREAAIVQSFPIDFVFFGSRTSAYRQIANAVPPRLACAVGCLFETDHSVKEITAESRERQPLRSGG
jgi:DNA (cytosine-5)-methyltransferase 1